MQSLLPVGSSTAEELLEGLIEGTLLVKDTLAADGSFMIPYLLKLALRQQYKVIFVTVQESLAHWQTLLRKLGVNLASYLASQQVAHISLLAADTPAWDTPAEPERLRQLYYQIIEVALPKADGADLTEPLLLLFDNLSVLACMQPESVLWTSFVYYCRTLGAHRQGSFCFAALAHEDIEADWPWLHLLEHHSQLVVQIDGLESGQSADITGRVEVMRRDVLDAMNPAYRDADRTEQYPLLLSVDQQSAGPDRRWYCYKLGEQAVTVFRQPGPS
ncbi:hypothetical protein WJX72_008405 [[Myrmecia] bisecta]|uniref:Elongator complex protein 6 n=1 Tax=[Myrmecia] bisecta TaxID=41462 RepID=A0AAW1PBT0_9CHLO